jgi:hypothetical protein
MKLFFAAIHSYLEPSSGAALATRELLELLTGCGFDCRSYRAGEGLSGSGMPTTWLEFVWQRRTA